MTIAEFIVEIVREVAWPITVLVILKLLHKPLVHLIPLISKIKYKDLEIDVTRQIEALKAVAPLPSLQSLAVQTPQAASELTKLLEILARSPRAAILEAWRLVEEVGGRKVAVAYGENLPPYLKSPLSIGEALRSREIITIDQYKMLSELRKIRNQANHAPEFTLSEDAGKDYIELAISLKNELEKL